MKTMQASVNQDHTGNNKEMVDINNGYTAKGFLSF
jgi:hypothetical protein